MLNKDWLVWTIGDRIERVKTLICEECGKIFLSGTNDEQCKSEYFETFGAEADIDAAEVVCEECYLGLLDARCNALMEETVSLVKKSISNLEEIARLEGSMDRLV